MAINTKIHRNKIKSLIRSFDWHSLKSYLRTNMSWHKITISLILLYAYGALILYLCTFQLLSPVDNASLTGEVIKINPGMDMMRIGSLLVEKGLIRNSLVFQLISVLNGTSRSLKAGDYLLNRNMGVSEIIQKMALGKTVLYRFTIPEGFTAAEIAHLWEVNGFGTADDFMKVVKDTSLRKKYGIDSNNLEGYLFPDTYMFPRGISEYEAVDKMLSQFNQKISPIMNVEKPLSRHEIISLASIIEKEAKAGEERPVISSVFHNRLKMDQRLESCATVLYGLGYPDRKLTYDDLKNGDSQYNTYVYKGLPPGPICNPGWESIVAALNPSKDKYLYFVSRNDGTHYFTESYSDFLSAKRKYQGT